MACSENGYLYFLHYDTLGTVLDLVREMDLGSPIRTVSWNPNSPALVAAGSFRGDIFLIDAGTGGAGLKYEIRQILNAESPDKILQVAWHPKFEHVLAAACAD